MRSMCQVLFKKKRLECMTKTVNLHVRLTQVVLEQVPCRWSSDSEAATTILKPWNNEKMAAGRIKMLSFSNLSDRCTQLRLVSAAGWISNLPLLYFRVPTMLLTLSSRNFLDPEDIFQTVSVT